MLRHLCAKILRNKRQNWNWWDRAQRHHDVVRHDVIIWGDWGLAVLAHICQRIYLTNAANIMNTFALWWCIDEVWTTEMADSSYRSNFLIRSKTSRSELVSYIVFLPQNNLRVCTKFYKCASWPYSVPLSLHVLWKLKFRVSDRHFNFEFEGSSYLLLSERQTWAGARSRCEELGARLPVIESSQQNTAIGNAAAGVFHAYRAFAH